MHVAGKTNAGLLLPGHNQQTAAEYQNDVTLLAALCVLRNVLGLLYEPALVMAETECMTASLTDWQFVQWFETFDTVWLCLVGLTSLLLAKHTRQNRRGSGTSRSSRYFPAANDGQFHYLSIIKGSSPVTTVLNE